MDHFLRLFNDLPANFQTRIYTSYPSCCRFLAQISPIKISFNFSIPFPSPLPDSLIHLIELVLISISFFLHIGLVSGNDSTDVTTSHHLQPLSILPSSLTPALLFLSA